MTTGRALQAVNRMGDDRRNDKKHGRLSPSFNPPFIFVAETLGRLEKQHVRG